MPKLGRKTPCAECPWLKKSAPGYLGADEPVHFYRASVVAENTPATAMPCHMEINYLDEDWLKDQYPDADICAGNLIHLHNWMKMPRDPELAKMVYQVNGSPHVFASPEEFMEHHGEENPKEMAERALWGFTE